MNEEFFLKKIIFSRNGVNITTTLTKNVFLIEIAGNGIRAYTYTYTYTRHLRGRNFILGF